LPLGVSLVTFTLTAYIVDIYRGIFPPGAKLSHVLAYVLFFPHLIAGPILRPAELLPQLARPGPLRRTWLLPGIAIFTLGLVKKLVFADPVSEVVDAIYHSDAVPSAPEALMALYGFSLQIYCDFSGYTDMAIGIALLLGVKLPENFGQPYCAVSLVDFWRRWHITLSYWLRDYLFIPLGGSHHGLTRQIVNVMITMALGGLWHGANWTFVFWGVLHGSGSPLFILPNAFGGRRSRDGPAFWSRFTWSHWPGYSSGRAPSAKPLACSAGSAREVGIRWGL
jgi:alginate O-acetyltransferase complex protein AlgI